MRTAIPKVALYVRIPLELRKRMDAELSRLHDEERRWGVNLGDMVTERLEIAFPARVVGGEQRELLLGRDPDAKKKAKKTAKKGRK